MPEAEAETPTTTTTTTTDPEAVTPEANSEKLGEAGTAAIRKEREARKELARQLKDAEEMKNALTAKVREFEDRDKSESQKLSDQIAELLKSIDAKDAEIVAARAASVRAEVAAEKKVPAASLSGTTREECESQADEIIAWAEANSPKRKPPTGSSALKSGATATGDKSADPKERAAAALRDMRRGT